MAREPNDIERRLSAVELQIAEMGADLKTLKTFVMNELNHKQTLILALLGIIGAITGVKALV